MSPTLKRRLLTGGSWVLAGKLATAAANVLTTSLLTRLLTRESFGAYGLAFSLVTAAALVSQLGLQQAIVRLVAESMSRKQAGRARAAVRFVYRHVGLGIVGVAALLVAGVGNWLALELWKSPALAGALTAVVGWMAVMSLQVLTSETFRGFEDLRLASIFGGVITGALALTALGILTLTRGSISLDEAVWISAGAAGASLVVGLWTLRRKISPLPKDGVITRGEVFSIALPLWVSSVTAFLLAQAALWIVGAFRSNEEVGLYFAAVRLVTLVSMPLILVNLVVPPFIAELYALGQRSRLQRVLRSAATLAGLPAFAVLSAFVLLGGPIMTLVFGGPYGAGAPILALLSIGYLVNVWTGSCGLTLSMTGHQTVLMRITLVSSALSVGGSLLVVRPYGTIGVAAVACATAILQNLSMWLAARYYAGVWTHATIPSRRDLRSLLARLPRDPGGSDTPV